MKKSRLQLSRQSAEKPFEAIIFQLYSGNYIQITQADWPKVVLMRARFERQKAAVHVFEWANFSGFATCEFTVREDLNPRKQELLLNLRLWSAQKPTSWSIFYRKRFI